jgi:hypothetical protein
MLLSPFLHSLDRCSKYKNKYNYVSLQLVAYMRCLAYEGRASELGYLLRHSIFDEEPGIVAGKYCALWAIREGSDGDGRWWVYGFVIDVEIKVVFTLMFGFVFGFDEPVH